MYPDELDESIELQHNDVHKVLDAVKGMCSDSAVTEIKRNQNKLCLTKISCYGARLSLSETLTWQVKLLNKKHALSIKNKPFAIIHSADGAKTL